MHAVDIDKLKQAYDRAQTSFLVAEDAPLDRIDITGRDRIDLLERLSTNSFKDARSGDHIRTALLEANGRLIDLLDVCILEDRLILLVSSGSDVTVKGWLERHIFFQDEVSIKQAQAWETTIIALGPQARDFVLAHLEDTVHTGNRGFLYGHDVLGLPLTWANSSGYRLFVDKQPAEQVISNARQPFTQADAFAALEAYRIQAGIPRRGQEIVPGIIPLEAGMRHVFSFSKGCYIGQEVIARLDSRGELAAKLTGLCLSKPARSGTELLKAGKPAGELTSSSWSPKHGWIGMGFVKTRRMNQDEGELSLEGNPCLIQKLPFPTT